MKKNHLDNKDNYFVLVFILIILVVSCNHNTEKKSYYNTGELQSIITVDNEGVRNGVSKTYYKNENLKEVLNFYNGTLIDTSWHYLENGHLDNIAVYNKFEDSILSIFYDKLGRVKKETMTYKKDTKVGRIKVYDFINNMEYLHEVKNVFGKDIYYDNQIVLNEFKDTIKELSFYYKVSVPDSVLIGDYVVGKIDLHSDLAMKDNLLDFKYNLKIMTNEKLNKNFSNINEIELDTFIRDDNHFLVNFSSTGNQNVRGKFVERAIIAEPSNETDKELTVRKYERDFYFDIPIYVKDSAR